MMKFSDPASYILQAEVILYFFPSAEKDLYKQGTG